MFFAFFARSAYERRGGLLAGDEIWGKIMVWVQNYTQKVGGSPQMADGED